MLSIYLGNLLRKKLFNSINPSNWRIMQSYRNIECQAHLKLCGDIVKSPNDRRDYRPLTLDNGIRALLISDEGAAKSEVGDGGVSGTPKEKTEKLSAAGLCINVGSFSDPPDLPGLAHFLEHMVFMGSSKYPDENDFEAFLSKHGGHSNAYTECERTIFYFEVKQEYFPEALDRFAHFFSDSLLKKETVDREIEAVDKEFCMSKLSDGSRLQQIYGTLAKPGHPMGKFMWGNSKTLKQDPITAGIDIHSRLREFYHRLYSSRYMTLALQSRDSLDDMEKWTKASFTPIKDNQLPVPKFEHLAEPFDTPQFYKLYKVVPVKKMHQIELFWCLPPTQEFYHVKPLHYLGWLLGHEGKGSILSYLKKRCWALSLSSGNCGSGFNLNSTMSAFSISVKLTDTGFKNIDKVLEAIFSYLKLLETRGPQETVYEEIQTIEENDFRFLEQSEPTRYVTELCENMQLYPVQEYLTGDVLMFKYDSKCISSLCSMLKTDNVNVTLVSDDYKTECNLTEPHYGTQYSVNDIPPEWIAKCKDISPDAAFHLPEKNEFIATDFSLKAPEPDLNPKYPTVISTNEHSRVYIRQDDYFKVPKAYYYFHLMTPYTYLSAKNTVLLDLYINLLQYSLSEVAYAANVAQLSYAFRSFETGMALQLCGFHHKLPKLFNVLIEHAINFQVDEEAFVNIQRQLKKSYYNLFIRPERLVRDVRVKSLKPVYWTPLDKYAFIDDVTPQELMTFVKKLFSELFVESYISGNVSREDAMYLDERFVKVVDYKPLPIDKVPKPRVHELPEGSTYCRIKSPLKDDDNCVITNYYQVGPGRDVKSMCVNEMLVMVMEEPCFNILRTKEQLGYSVFAVNRNTDQILAFSVSVCSKQTKFSLDQLDAHIEKFMTEFGDILSNMSDEDFSHQRQALISLKRCEDSNLKERVDRDWEEILWRRYMFARLELEVVELEKLTRAQILEYFQRYSPYKQNRKFCKLSVQVEACPEKEETSGKVTTASGDAETKMEESDDEDDSDDSDDEDEEDQTANMDDTDYSLKLLSIPDKNSITDIVTFRSKLHLYEHITVSYPKIES